MLEWGRAIVPSWISNKLTKEKIRKKKKKKKKKLLSRGTHKKQTNTKDPLYQLIIVSQMQTQSSQILKSSKVNHFILFYFKYEMGLGSH